MGYSRSMSAENLELVHELYSRLEKGDFAMGEFFDPQVELIRIGADAVGAAGTWRGLDEMWKTMVEWLQAWEDLRVEAERCIDVDDRVLVLERQTARGKRSGLPYDRETGQLFTIRHRKIVRWESYWERDEALAAAGVPA